MRTLLIAASLAVSLGATGAATSLLRAPGLASLGVADLAVAGLGIAPAHAQQGRSGPEPFGPERPERKSPDPRAGKDKDGKGKEADAQPKPIPKSMRRPGGTSVPEAGSQRALLLADLYSYLATATDEEVARRTAAAIEHVWLTSGSDTVNLLMERAVRAASEKKPELALKLLDRAITLAPDYPEVFSRRAVVHFAQGNIEQAVGDLRRVLALDPNHYKALEGLAQIFKEIGRKKAALEIYRRLLQVHPLMSGAKAAYEELAREVEGQAS